MDLISSHERWMHGFGCDLKSICYVTLSAGSLLCRKIGFVSLCLDLFSVCRVKHTPISADGGFVS